MCNVLTFSTKMAHLLPTVGKKNVLYIIEESGKLSHPDAGTPLTR
jgi:hypothetical protein